jgi:hypothetical protein
MDDNEFVRIAVPDSKSRVELFTTQLDIMADLCGIRKIPELNHQVDLLSRAIDNYLFQKKHGGTPAKEIDEKQRFIAIFRNRFRVANEYDYPNTVTPVDAKSVEQFITKLKSKSIDSDFYLEWYFDSFLVRKPVFNPATIRGACCNVSWGEFVYDNKSKLQDKKEQALQESEALDLINRSREAMRRTEDAALKTKISELVKKYRDGGIIFTEFRKQIL